MVHQQANNLTRSEQASHSATRGSGHLMGMIKRVNHKSALVLQNDCYARLLTQRKACPTAEHIGGSVRVLPGSRGHSACCRLPRSMPVDPALTALWAPRQKPGLHGPALPDMDFRNRASSNFSTNIVSESDSTAFVECLVRLQAKAASDDLFLDLGGAAEDRRDQRCTPNARSYQCGSRLLPWPRGQ